MENFFLTRPQVSPHEHDGGNDLARLFYRHHVADADVLARDFLRVVQRRARDSRAADGHRLQFRHRRQNPRAPDLDDDVAQTRLGALGRVLVRHRPARGFARQAEPRALPEIVHLDHRAVRLILEIVTHRVEFADGCDDPLGGISVHNRSLILSPSTVSSRNISLCERSSAAPPAIIDLRRLVEPCGANNC